MSKEGLVTDWQANATGDVVTLTIRPKVKCHNGEPLTAAGASLLTGRVLPAANQIDLRFRYAPPWPLAGSSLEPLLGTDRLGRDLLSRMLVGAQNS